MYIAFSANYYHQNRTKNVVIWYVPRKIDTDDV